MTFLLRLLIGALGGLSATGPMTILMEFLHRRLPWKNRYSLPPREITEKLAEKAGVEDQLHGETKSAVVLLNHFAYGGAMGGIYGALFGCTPRQGVAKGIVFGVLVWLVSYFGLLPAASLLKPAQKHPAPRNGLMFLAHILFGALLGAFVEMVETERDEVGGALIEEPAGPARNRKNDKAGHS